ncbi:hypothetical protein GCM10028794_25700 [Silanimonas algicola]
MEDRDEPTGPRSPAPLPPEAGATLSVDARTESLDTVAAAVFQQSLEPLRALVSRGDTEELAVGDRLGHWTLTERLGQGGMGSVFVAERDDGLFRQRVAVKILRRPADAEAASHLDAERALLAGLVHPGVARLYDGGSTPGGQPFLVLEHVEGRPLNRWRHEDAPTLEARLALFDRLCDAVAYAHRQFVVHCDLKPSNILVRADGTPMLLDFGIARWIGSDATDGASERRAGTYCTPAYASPEQVAGGRPGVASDVFSLGIVLAELLADAPMQRGAGDIARPARRPSDFAAGAALAWRRQLRGDLDAIVAKATALEPGARYPDVAALRSDLGRYRDHLPVSARPAAWPRRGLLFLRRYRGGAIAAGVGLAMAAGFTAQLVQERDRAREAAATAEQVSQFMVGAFDAANVRLDGGQRDLRARDVLKAGAERIERDLAGQPGVQARLLLALGGAYASLGEDREAKSLLARAVALAEGRDEDALVAIEALEHQSVIAGNEARGDEALAFAQRAAALRREHGHDDTDGLGSALNHVGLALRAVRRYDEARDALVESLRLRRQLPPEEIDQVISTLNNLGLVERLDGRPEAALPYYEEAIALARQVGASGDYSLHNALSGLGRAYAQQRRFEDALPALRESHAIALRLYGEASPMTASAIAELGIVYWDLGRLEEAEGLLRRTLHLARTTEPDDRMSIAIAMNNLGLLLDERGDPSAALPLVEGSLAIRREHLEADDPALRRAVFNTARIELHREAPEAARARIAPYVEELLGHPQESRTEWWSQAILALEVAWRAGRPAEDVLETLFAWPSTPADTAFDAVRWRLQRLKARLLLDAGRSAAATATIEHAVAGVRRGGSRLDLAVMQLTAAQIAEAAGDPASARGHLAEAGPALDDLHVEGSALRREAAALAARLGR